ncbi:hypothetical protein IV203_007130 [Nitzschia inconspicua]|uniref:Uncharacterized protein n=1 Tax=Nitzschia inconspicua TaxID=303405 RepID=A0A9K3KEB4_9STRA|nr:hypothetical protein IV203_007130 [Nitzschia inconspicua]
MSEEMDAPLLLKATKDQVNLLQSNESESNMTDVLEAATKLGPIFYNVYVPEERSNDTLQIIEEQIRFRNDTDPDAPILYTLIGSRKVKGSIQRMCQPNCTRRKYLQEGNEIDTLHALWEYCQDNPSDIVTYIHDKGSFHPSDANHNARGVGTKAALQCRRLMMNQHTDVDPTNDRTVSNTTDKTKKAKSTCSICSYRFYAFPIYHARANMWTAECSYIRDLLPPRQYESTVLDMYRETSETSQDIRNHKFFYLLATPGGTIV